ncbi:methyltransferase regulatory domain-containing protein [Pseudoroseomonas wenyumeiae]
MRQDDHALAHELLPAHWQPFHVAEMMAAFAEAGCRYLGSATPPENIDAVSLPAATRPLVAGLADPALAETARDIARNQALRRDLYMRGGQPCRRMRICGPWAGWAWRHCRARRVAAGCASTRPSDWWRRPRCLVRCWPPWPRVRAAWSSSPAGPARRCIRRS